MLISSDQRNFMFPTNKFMSKWIEKPKNEANTKMRQLPMIQEDNEHKKVVIAKQKANVAKTSSAKVCGRYCYLLLYTIRNFFISPTCKLAQKQQ